MTDAARRTGAYALPALALAGVALVVLVAMSVLGVGARRGSDDDGAAAPVTSTTTAPARSPASERDIASPVLGPVVVVDGDGTPQAVGSLRSDTVLQLRLRDFEPRTTVRVTQCVAERCANSVRVHVGPTGAAAADYLVVDDGRCRIDAPACTIVAASADGDRRAEVTTIFEDALPPPGVLQVTPRRQLVPGDVLDVRVTGVVPGVRLDVVVCSRPREAGSDRCTSTTQRVVTADEVGAAATSLTVDASACTGDHRCDVAVRSSDAFVRATPVPLSFAAAPGAAYDRGRLVAGLVVAVALVAAAAYFIRRTDWSPVGEEAAPEIDDADFADLDAIIAALPPEEEPTLVEG